MTIYWNLRQRGQTIAVSRSFTRNDREAFIFLTKHRIKYWSEHLVFRLLLIWVFFGDGLGNLFCFFFTFYKYITFIAVGFYYNCLQRIVRKPCNIVIRILLSEWLWILKKKNIKEILIKYCNVVYWQYCCGSWWVTNFFFLTKVLRRNGCIKYYALGKLSYVLCSVSNNCLIGRELSFRNIRFIFR